MFTIENVMADIKSLVLSKGAVEGLKACDIKFKDAGCLELYEKAKIQIAKDIADKQDIAKA
jgi:hypothetical protein